MVSKFAWMKSSLSAGLFLLAWSGSGFAADDPNDILPVEFRCFASSAQLYSKNFKGDVTLLDIEHDTETISYSLKRADENKFRLIAKTPIKDIESTSDEKMKGRFDFILVQMRIIETEVCLGKADARARFFEMLRENARRTNYEK
jgi:hypothetical protein